MNWIAGVSYIQRGRGGRTCTERPLAENNTRIRRDGKDVVIRLHETDILRIKPDGTQILDSGGWKTATTKARLAKYIEGAYLYAHQSIWYLSRDLGACPEEDCTEGQTAEDCKKCEGTGKVQCRSCKGTPSPPRKCETCGGTGKRDRARAAVSFGAGELAGRCHVCGGRGTLPGCFSCNDSGKTYCRACAGSGKARCTICKGTGRAEALWPFFDGITLDEKGNAQNAERCPSPADLRALKKRIRTYSAKYIEALDKGEVPCPPEGLPTVLSGGPQGRSNIPLDRSEARAALDSGEFPPELLLHAVGIGGVSRATAEYLRDLWGYGSGMSDTFRGHALESLEKVLRRALCQSQGLAR